MRAAQIAALIAVTILALTISVRIGIKLIPHSSSTETHVVCNRDLPPWARTSPCS